MPKGRDIKVSRRMVISWTGFRSGGGCSSVVECLTSMCEALGSIPTTRGKHTSILGIAVHVCIPSTQEPEAGVLICVQLVAQTLD